MLSSPLHEARVPRDLRLPDERGGQRAHGWCPGTSRHVDRERPRGRRRHPHQHLCGPRARRAAGARAPGRVLAPQGAAPRPGGGGGGLHGAAPARPPARPCVGPRPRGRPGRLQEPSRAAAARRPWARRPHAPGSRRDLRRPRAQARQQRARLGHGAARLRQVLHLLRGALHPRPRAEPAASRPGPTGGARRRTGIQGGRVPRPVRQLLH